MRQIEKVKVKEEENSTHIDFLPLADIANQPGEPEEPDEAEELGQPEDAQGSPGVQQLEAREAVLV